MPIFVWTAKDKTGALVVRELNAETIEESKAQLVAEGCSDLVLRDDEIMAAARDGFVDKPKVFGEQVEVTPQQRFQHRGKPRRTYPSDLREPVSG